MDLLEKKVDLNLVASDIIIHAENELLINLETGKKGALEDVIRDKSFICMPYDSNSRLKGYYAEYDKEKDALLFIIAQRNLTANNGWMETGRGVFWWENGTLKYEEKSRIGTVVCQCGYFDICGQSVVYRLDKDNGKLTVPDIYPKNSGFMDACMAFFGGMLHISGDENEMTFILKIARDVLNIIFYCESRTDDVIKKGGIRQEKKLITKEEDSFPPVPDEAIRRMKKCVIAELKNEVTLYPRFSNILTDNSKYFSVLQEVNGEVWIRKFIFNVAVKYPIDDSAVTFMEFKRGKIEKGVEETEQSHLILYAEGLENTFLKYNTQCLDEWLDTVKRWADGDWPEELIPDECESFQLEQNMFVDMSFRFSEKYNIDSDNLVTLIKMLSENPITERLYKAEFPHCINLKRFLGKKIARMILIKDKDLQKLFGQIQDGKTINQMLGIPSGLLEYTAKINAFDVLKLAKGVFAADKDYLMRLNINDAENIMDLFRENVKEDGVNCLKRVLQKMILLFGKKGLQSYVNFWHAVFSGSACMDDKENMVKDYDEYLDILLSIGEAAQGCQWKLSGEALHKTKSSLYNAYALSLNQIQLENVNRMIKMREETFKKFAYEKDSFLISWPVSTSDIIKEGVALNHCAKTYIDAVAYGETVMLFIRLKSNPIKPFYTLEIKDGAVRQCHGFNNRNIDQEPGLEKFLRGFCERKNLSYSSGIGLYNAE